MRRKRIAKLAAGDHLALPQIVLDYLDRLAEMRRRLGLTQAEVAERMHVRQERVSADRHSVIVPENAGVRDPGRFGAADLSR